MIPVPCKKCSRRDAAPCDDKGTCFTCRGLKFEYGEIVLHVHESKFRIVGTLGAKILIVEYAEDPKAGRMIATEKNLRKMPEPSAGHIKIFSEAH